MRRSISQILRRPFLGQASLNEKPRERMASENDAELRAIAVETSGSATLPLHQIYRDIIERAEQDITLQSYREPQYLDDVVSKCFREIAIREGRPDIAKCELRRIWRMTSWPQYQELANYLRGRFDKRYAALRQARKEAEHEKYKEWLSQRRSVVDRFLEIADRKVSLLDDYGDERWDALPKEIATCLLKLAKTEGDNGVTEAEIREDLKKDPDFLTHEKYEWLKLQLESEFRTYHEQHDRRGDVPEFQQLSGTEFEIYLAGLLKQRGFENIRGTPTSGDQGADLLATKNGRTIAIQAKRYLGSVGNRAVQEVTAAVRFYGADEGWVITSGSFTASAKALAKANGVNLVDGYALTHGILDTNRK